VDTDANYQLNIEDAEAVSRYQTVVFVDASVEAAPPYEFSEVQPSAEIAMTTHELRPGAVLALCEQLYGRRPRAHTLAIPGYAWDLQEGLSVQAEANLAAALDFLVEWLRAGPANGPSESGS
jgi:Ni,Fe-hydrogenase maturation factor